MAQRGRKAFKPTKSWRSLPPPESLEPCPFRCPVPARRLEFLWAHVSQRLSRTRSCYALARRTLLLLKAIFLLNLGFQQ